MSLRFLAGWPALLIFIATSQAQVALGPREELVIDTASGRHAFQVELADEPRERATGLMYRRDLAKGQGMLFDFGAEEPVSMWMANRYIPLDMLFIEAVGTVESIAKRTTPMSRRSVASQGEVRYVLEING